MTRGERGKRAPRPKPGVKREQIINVAIDRFGRDGYEETKWADVAAAVDIGSTTLYHYFESKQHCLFEIMGMAVADFRGRFDRLTLVHEDWSDALVAVLRDQFDILARHLLARQFRPRASACACPGAPGARAVRR